VKGLRVTLGRFNLSINAVKHHPKRLTEELALLMRDCDSLGISEGGAAEKIIRTAARLAGGRVWFGEGKVGQASTPVYVGPHCKAVRFEAIPLTKQGRKIGKGAGPDRGKAKHLMVALFEKDGEQYADGNIHVYASLWNPVRLAAALVMINRANRHMRTHYKDRHRSLGGDLNDTPGARAFLALRRWLRSTQRALGPEGTHGRRAIDEVYVDKTLRPISHEDRPTVSDHDAYLVVVTPREHR
jgi:hypothetical protein